MIFTSIRIRNFGRFYGTHTIDLSNGLYIIHGENGLGKTTFLNAVKWAMYGEYFDRQGRRVAPEAAINSDAYREGDKSFQVTLGIDDGGAQLLLRRTQAVAGGTNQRSELYLERNGVPQSQVAAGQTINRLLSAEVSRFFFFDGEQLQAYESLLFRDDSETRLVKQSIEQILGLPAFDNAVHDLRAVQEEFGRRQAALARADRKSEAKGLLAEQKAKDLDAARSDMAELLEQDAKLLAIVQRNDEFLQAYEASLGTLRKIEATESEISEMQKRSALLKESRATALRGAWVDVLASAVAPRARELDEELVAEHRMITESILVDHRRREIEGAIAGGRCTLCGHLLDDADLDHLAHEMGEMPATSSQDGQRTPRVGLRMASLATIVSTGQIDQAIDLDRRVSELQADVVAKRQDLSRLRAVIDDLPENAVNAAQRERDQAQQELGRQREHIERREADIRDLVASLQRALADIRSESQDVEQQKLGVAMDTASGLVAVFEEAKGRFREQVRSRVETDASDVFVQITNEPTFAGLRINENYGLEILNDRNEVVAMPSAGQQQLVALALIAALNRNALRSAPVMMDTPFGRLDPSHRANVLKFVSGLAEQVFLLVHSGEVAQIDLDVVRGEITQEFDLVRSGPDRTDLMPGGTGA